MANEPSGPTGPSEGLLLKGGSLFLTNCRDKQPIFGPADDPCSDTVNEDCCSCGKSQCECANPPCYFKGYPDNTYTEWEDTETYQKLFLCDAENTNGYGMRVFSGGINSWWGWYGGWWGYGGWAWWWGGWWGWGWGWGWGGYWGGWYWGYGGLLPNQENTACTPAIRWKEDFYRKWFCGEQCYVYMTWAYDNCSTPWGDYESVEAGENCSNRFRGCCPSAPETPCDCTSNCIGCGRCGGNYWGWGYGWGYGWGWGWGSTFSCHCYEPTGEQEELRYQTCDSGCPCPPCWSGYIGGYEIWQAKYGSCYKGYTSASVMRLILWDCETGGWQNVTEEAFEVVPGTISAPGDWIGWINWVYNSETESYDCVMNPEEEWGSRWKIEMADGGIKTSNQSRPGYYSCEQCEGDNPCGWCCYDGEPFTYCAWPEECSPKVRDIEEYPTECPEPPTNPDCP